MKRLAAWMKPGWFQAPSVTVPVAAESGGGSGASSASSGAAATTGASPAGCATSPAMGAGFWAGGGIRWPVKAARTCATRSGWCLNAKNQIAPPTPPRKSRKNRKRTKLPPPAAALEAEARFCLPMSDSWEPESVIAFLVAAERLMVCARVLGRWRGFSRMVLSSSPG